MRSDFHSYLVLTNLQKDHNVGALLRSADAFGVREVILVGRRTIPSTAAVGAHRFVKRTTFHRFDDAIAHVRGLGARVLGVEIDDRSVPLDEHPFDGTTAFVLGNEGEGLTPAQRARCDRLVRIRQYGHVQSLNVHLAGAIALHHFALWAGYAERPIDGSKFVPDPDGADPRVGH